VNYLLDLLPAVFLAGLLTAAVSLVGMARAVARAAARRAAPAGGGPGGDLLKEYLQACADECRAPRLWYAYLASLWVGLGALVLAFL
jgi:hypothetical protein